MIAPEKVQEILNAARIEDVIGDFVNLKKRGINYIGNCPFHQEKTPSFTVSAAKGIYKCFGCGKAGNVTKFLMDHEHFSFAESLEWLGKRYNIIVEQVKLSPAQRQEVEARERLFEITSFAQKYFTNNLWNQEEGKAVGLSYFKERNFRDDVIQKFMLGYCLDQNSAFTDHAIASGYHVDDLKKLGLTRQQQNGDFFRGRVIFPIINLSGKVAGFGGRTLKKDKSVAKYFNSPESDIYNKSQIVYGIYQARTAIKKNDFCFLVEGYTDVISLHQGGLENVVASSGTALTPDQVRLIRRYTNNIVLLYDGDAAGIKAAQRGLEIIIEEGMNLKLVILPDDEDPDSFMQKNGAAAFNDFVLKNAKDFIRFLMGQMIGESKADPFRKAAVSRELIELLAKIPDSFVRTEYIKEFCSLMQLAEQMVTTEVNKLVRAKLKKQTDLSDHEAQLIHQQVAPHLTEDLIKTPATVSISTDDQERQIIKMLVEFGDKEIDEAHKTVAGTIAQEVELSNFDNPIFARIFNECLEAQQSNTLLTKNYFVAHADEEIAKVATELMSFAYELSPNWELKHQIQIKPPELKVEDNLRSSLYNFNLRKLLKMIEENMQELNKETDEMKIAEKQHIHKFLSAKRMDMGKAAGIVVLK